MTFNRSVFFFCLGTNVLFIDGNHENFNAVKRFPIENWNGVCSHKISENIRFLCRSQIFTICGKTFLTLGGADSHDKENRIDGESWWKEERITKTDIDVAYKNLWKVDFKVDYILTHTPSNIFAKSLTELPVSRRLTEHLKAFLKKSLIWHRNILLKRFVCLNISLIVT